MTRITILTALFVLPVLAAYSQTATRLITGTVKSADTYDAIDGATIAVRGRNYASGTQSDGVFFLDIKPGDSLLVVSCGGFREKFIALSHEKEYNILLSRAVTQDRKEQGRPQRARQ